MEELDHLFSTYCDTNRELTLDAFSNIMSDLTSPRLTRSAIVRAARNSADDLRAIFRAFDVDDNNVVEEHEFMLGFCIYTDTSRVHSAEFMFEAMDTDNNGNKKRADFSYCTVSLTYYMERRR